eukprot:Sdes_comp20457_c0_seq4m14676
MVILWLDCDKEGENICFEVLENVLPCMQIDHNRYQKDASYASSVVFRARFSSITEKEIFAAMKTLVFPSLNESLSVDARQELDLRIGCAFTRFQTKFFQGKYGNLDSNLISYGPCQTPTLGFVVARHDEIQSFQPEPFWTLELSASKIIPNSALFGAPLRLKWSRGKIFEKSAAQLFHQLFTDDALYQSYHDSLPTASASSTAPLPSTARILDVAVSESKRVRPLALNTVEMLKLASHRLGIGPHQTMQYAERLYMQGYISYPRTETTDYGSGTDLKAIVHMLAAHPGPLSIDARGVLEQGLVGARPGADRGDHPPITPSRAADPAELGELGRLYDFIVRRFLASLSPDAVIRKTVVKASHRDQEFHCTWDAVASAGYLAVLSDVDPDEISSSHCPSLCVGDLLRVENVVLCEAETTPPDYLSESDLISLMEKHGIGTDASIAVHIQNIVERNYCQILAAGRKLKPTNLGIVLIHGYHKIDPDLALPTIRAAVEKQLDFIASGKADFAHVLQYTVDIFRRKFSYFQNHIAEMDQLFEANFSPLSATGKVLSKCGKCRRYMKYIAAKPSRIYCPNCDETYSLPQNGTIKLYKENSCPLDDFELVLFSTGSKGKTFPLCPYCYNHPPFQEINKGMNCHTCPHQTCKHSLNHHRVANCEECQVGDLVIDPVSAPNWKIACNHCQCVLKFQPDVIFKMKVVSGSSLLPSSQFSDHSSNPPPDDLPDLEDLSLKQAQPHQRDQHQKNQPESSNSFCDSCGANQIHLVFVKDKSPL